MGSLFLLQQIFLTQESNLGALHCRQVLYQLSYQGSPNSLGKPALVSTFHQGQTDIQISLEACDEKGAIGST